MLDGGDFSCDVVLEGGRRPCREPKATNLANAVSKMKRSEGTRPPGEGRGKTGQSERSSISCFRSRPTQQA